MIMHITNADTISPMISPHGETVFEYMGKAAGGAAAHSLARIVLAPGAAAPKHYHLNAEESYFILSGQGVVILDGETRTVKPGDAVAIPIRTVHQILNDGQKALIFLAVCVPAWTPECSIYTDEMRPTER